MNSQIICLNPNCIEVPIISLIYSNECFKINTDCPIHHYQYRLEEYLNLLKNLKKEYLSICYKHNKKYIGFVEESHINICDECISKEKEKEKLLFFKEIKFEEEAKKFKVNSSLMQLYNIILQNFNNALKNNKLVAGIYLNFIYINSLNDYSFIPKEDEIKIDSNINNIKDADNFYDNPFKANSKYLIYFIENNKITVYIQEKNEYIIGYDDSFPCTQLELSPFYYQIFLTVSDSNIKIWEISEEKKTITLITIIYLENGEKEKFKLAKFSNINEKYISSVSFLRGKYSIKIWSLDKIFNIFEINNLEKRIYNIIFSPDNESIIGFEGKSSIYIYDLNEKKYIKRISNRPHQYFDFIDSENIIIIYDDIVEIRKINKNDTKTKKIKFTNVFKYYYENDLLYIFHNYLSILDLRGLENNLIREIKNIKFNINDLIILMNDKQNNNKQNNFFNFIIIHNLEMYFYPLFSNYFIGKSSKNKLKINSYYFLENIRKRLYTKSELSFNDNNIELGEIYKKEYLKMNIYQKRRMKILV